MKKIIWIMALLGVLAADERVVIGIDAMHCPLCVFTINQALRSTEGVKEAKASLKTKSATVVVPNDFDLQLLLDAVAETGYTGVITSKEALKND